MTTAQQIAADPARSVWVSASAGTGKTRVLTERVLRLLLRGAEAESLLCITYTNAAAAEIRQRVQTTLADWVTLPEEALHGQLSRLLGSMPETADIACARRLFAELVDAPQGLRVQTIHGFCQMALRHFPLESGVAPHFTVADDSHLRPLHHEARRWLLTDGTRENPALAAAVDALLERLPESEWDALLYSILSKRATFEAFFHRNSDPDSIRAACFKAQDVQPDDTPAALMTRAFAEADAAEMQRVAEQMLETGGKAAQAAAPLMAAWHQPDANREALWPEYFNAMMTQKNMPRKLVSKSLEAHAPDIAGIIASEQARITAVRDGIASQQIALFSAHTALMAHAWLARFQQLKQSRNLLDFDDLIAATLRLLSRPGIAPWVLYKLDGGITHILLDEAQDTSPSQWRLLQLLTGDMLSGESREEGAAGRSMFVVGDEKQSIYRFQGAAPEWFDRMQQHFAHRHAQSRRPFRQIRLDRSFRSTEAVLHCVDAVFAQPRAGHGLHHGDLEMIRHEAHRSGHGGEVICWPLVKEEPLQEAEPPAAGEGAFPPRWRASKSAQVRLAEQVAGYIAALLHDPAERLASRNRRIRPGDIMILLRKRTQLLHILQRKLKAAGISVSGVDRLKLTEHIAVQDLLALGEWLLLPEDDYALACVLKSPIGGLDDERLFPLCHNRDEATLWQRLWNAQNSDPVLESICTRLAGWLNRVDYVSPYGLFSDILEAGGVRTAMAARLGAEAHEPLDAFLEHTLAMESRHPPSLQRFLQEMRTEKITIKRDMEQAGDQVRIMTVHGAKGLQAPIVMLPDTTSVSWKDPASRDRILWMETAQETPVPVVSPGADSANDRFRALREAWKEQERAEYNRLLYVALTRAEDRLIIGGYEGKRAPDADCWYTLVRDGLRSLVDTGDTTLEDETLRYTQPQTVAPTSEPETPAVMENTPAPPLWLGTPWTPDVPVVSVRPPSHMTDADESTTLRESATPVTGETLTPAERGTLLHRLLEVLPGVAPEDRPAAGQALLRASGLRAPVSGAEALSLIEEVLHVLASPACAHYFALPHVTEASLAGRGNGNGDMILGQADRLCLDGETLYVMDYKSNLHPPLQPQDTPSGYLMQMSTYRRLAASAFPGKAIRCVLLWTHTATPMEIPESLLTMP